MVNEEKASRTTPTQYENSNNLLRQPWEAMIRWPTAVYENLILEKKKFREETTFLSRDLLSRNHVQRQIRNSASW